MKLWVERGMLSGLTKINCILVIVILSSILAAGIVQDTFAGEKLEKARAGGWRLLIPPGPENFPVSY